MTRNAICYEKFPFIKSFRKNIGLSKKSISLREIIDWKNIKLFVHSYYNERPRIILFEKIELNTPKANYIVVSF